MDKKEGIIVRIISNLYTVLVDGVKYDCRARGLFRNQSIKPLVGDKVVIDIKELYILDVLPRRNELARPQIANVDKCIIITTCKRPDFSSFLLDKIIVNVLSNNIEAIICFTKYDLLNEEEKEKIDSIIAYYKSIGIKTFINSEISLIKEEIKNSTIVLTGQSGAGKSTLINKLDTTLNLETNDISEALNRGKHTTRHVELYEVAKAHISDTPGFSALDIMVDKYDVRFYFQEFKNSDCKFNDCLHINEIGCKVKEQVSNNEILESRYKNYLKILEEMSR